MTIKVGIPRSLLFYYYYPLWKEFFEGLGCIVVVSEQTNKQILDHGVKHAVDEACLPVKVAFGHVQNLITKDVDYIFLPRLVSVARREYICPKFLGFPDMVKQNLPGLPAVLDPTINYGEQQRNVDKAYKQMAKNICHNPVRIWQAYRQGCKALEHYQKLILQGYLPDEALAVMYGNKKTSPATDQRLTLAVIGHPYNLYDHYINMNLFRRLKKMGVKILTSDHLSQQDIRQQTDKLPKKLFWTLGQRMIGAGFHYGEKDVDGIIHISAFACGLDSMTGELIERHIRNSSKLPFLNLILDEHTGEAGVITRVEAFLDMVQRNKSSHISDVNCC